jgi:hypothetical protein
MKKRSPSSEQNGQLMHWWLLVHSGQETRGKYQSRGKQAAQTTQATGTVYGLVLAISKTLKMVFTNELARN